MTDYDNAHSHLEYRQARDIAIRKLYGEGYSLRAIAEALKVSHMTVFRALNPRL